MVVAVSVGGGVGGGGIGGIACLYHVAVDIDEPQLRSCKNRENRPDRHAGRGREGGRQAGSGCSLRAEQDESPSMMSQQGKSPGQKVPWAESPRKSPKVPGHSWALLF